MVFSAYKLIPQSIQSTDLGGEVILYYGNLPYFSVYQRTFLTFKSGATVARVLLAEPTVVIVIFQAYLFQFTRRSNSMLRQPQIRCGSRTRTCDLLVMSQASYQLLYSAIYKSSGKATGSWDLTQNWNQVPLHSYYRSIPMIRHSPDEEYCKRMVLQA